MPSASPFSACMERVAEMRRRSAAAAEQRLVSNGSFSPDPSSTTPGIDVISANERLSLSTSHSIKKKRSQSVLTISQRKTVVNLMTETAQKDGDKHIASKAIRAFPLLFSGLNNANIQRAMRLWNDRHNYTNTNNINRRNEALTITRNTKWGLHRLNMKAKPGRGRHRTEWVEILHVNLRSEFDRLRRVGVKFSHSTLRLLALNLLRESNNGIYGSEIVDPRSGKAHAQIVDFRWIQTFADRFQIVRRMKCGKAKMSPAKTAELEISTARHLGMLKRAFESGKYKEDEMSNADETHFVFNMDNGKTLVMCGDKEVRYADVTSGGEGITMLVRLSGARSAKTEPPFLIFTNKSRSYPIRGTPDNIPGVSYRTGPKGSMDCTNMIEWLKEERAIKRLPDGKVRTLFIDSCSSHSLNEDILSAAKNIRTTLRYFPPNSTDLNQPCDSFVIQKLKDAWRKRWDEYKLGLIRSNAWTTGGRLPYPGKSFFLRLAADVVRDVNAERDENGLTYARKAMILCGLSLNTNGVWEERQLKPELQNIIKKYRQDFENPDDGDFLSH